MQLYQKQTPTQVFSHEICKLFKNIFYYRTFPVAASENNEQQQLSECFANICYKIVSPILLQEHINYFAVCKHYGGTLVEMETRTTYFKYGPHF